LHFCALIVSISVCIRIEFPLLLENANEVVQDYDSKYNHNSEVGQYDIDEDSNHVAEQNARHAAQHDVPTDDRLAGQLWVVSLEV